MCGVISSLKEVETEDKLLREESEWWSEWSERRWMMCKVVVDEPETEPSDLSNSTESL